jgi:hypothetical protein
MATAEHTSSSSLPVRQHRPAGWGTVMAAMLLALLAAFGRSPPVAMAAADSSPELIELTLLTGAKEKGAGLYILSSIASLFFLFFSFIDGLFTYIHALYICSVLGWKPAGLPLSERFRLRISQLDRISSGD